MNKDNRIFSYLRKYRWTFLSVILLGSLTILFGAALMFTSGYLISKAATRPESILMVYVPIVGVRTFGIGRAVLSYVEKLIGHNLILKILSRMRVSLYKSLEPQALLIRSRFQTGDMLSVLADDIEHLQDYYLKTLFPAIISLTIYTVMIICAGLFSMPFAIMLAIFIGLLIFVVPFFSLVLNRAKNEHLKRGRNRLYRQFTDAIFGISDWIFSGHYSGLIMRLEQQEDKLLEIEKEKASFVNWRDVVNHAILGFIVVITIYWAKIFTINGEVQPTLIAAFGLVMLTLLESFLPIAEAVSETSIYQESFKRLDSIQNTESLHELITEMPHPLQPGSSISIDLHHVTFGYSGKKLLDNIMLNVKQGEKIAIIGRSGSGKSTLLKLIYGALVPTTGEVTIIDLPANKLEPLMAKMMAVLNQKAYLFNTTVLNNIRLGNQAATVEEVYKAAEMVQLNEMITKLPDGYETNIQETGQRFSGGERQRIALARILLQNTPIVLLDEPTVGLDPITETSLLNTIFATLEGKTIIWVTHHLIGVEKMDRILFLDHGKIVMDGTHQQLLKNESRYRLLYTLDRPSF
ncbi:thiol reductant ABC exporter subunit CydC [Neobacillus sp. MM2021_6]|uniref:thiol reductant ABC exporter subunit CydC n=1 Tax=Bacillaceae TaxID=186817 RepID=UPI00140BDE16|nr:MULTISPECIES: thiol reductant ABC exporter subunit CydC [Bacillaceae]MBO0958237.1 thiol reductant ABC exporter subunit CydC [Neobacillus sp. MM2021_6]NHC17836.1 thiol reductant ABC exporter subunit CydC [Bacillus sp. MM2020_4]